VTDPPATETPEIRLKRLRIRSWHRGIKEMDLILGPFADSELPRLDAETLDLYDRMLEENDWDLYYWVTGAREAPETYAPLIRRLALFHNIG
jgi:antitoxin CptB